MNLRRLTYFLRIASEGSLSRTARHFGIAQPALTRQIQLLESELGVRLFERLPRGLRLTEQGEFFRQSLELPMQEIETAIAGVRSFSKNVKATITIGLPPAVSALIGCRLVTRLREELPNVALRVYEADSNKLAFDLSRRLLDVAILVSTAPEQRVSHARVLCEPMFLVGAPDAPAVQRQNIRFKELEQLPMVMPSSHSGLHILLSRAALNVGVKFTPAIELESVEIAKQLVRKNGLYALMTERNFREEAKRNELTGIPVIDPAIAMPVFWAVKPDWRLPRALYNELERVVFEEWYDAVVSGDWPADWVFDFNLLSIPFGRKKQR